MKSIEGQSVVCSFGNVVSVILHLHLIILRSAYAMQMQYMSGERMYGSRCDGVLFSSVYIIYVDMYNIFV